MEITISHSHKQENQYQYETILLGTLSKIYVLEDIPGTKFVKINTKEIKSNQEVLRLLDEWTKRRKAHGFHY